VYDYVTHLPSLTTPIWFSWLEVCRFRTLGPVLADLHVSLLLSTAHIFGISDRFHGVRAWHGRRHIDLLFTFYVYEGGIWMGDWSMGIW